MINYFVFVARARVLGGVPLMLSALVAYVAIALGGPQHLCAGDSADVVVTDQWLVGSLNNTPIMTVHAVVDCHASGTVTDIMDTHLVINRQLGGLSSKMETQESQHFEENPHGEIVAFQFDHTENEQAPISAQGRIEKDEVICTLHHLGRTTEQRIPIPAGTHLLGEKASQDLLAKHTWQPKESISMSSLALISNEVRLITITATFKQATSDGNLVFDTVMDAMPVSSTMTLTPKGDLVGMSMSLGFFAISVLPTATPVVLGGATLPSGGLVTATGGIPSDGGHNRYRLPDGCAAVVDGFQSQSGQIVTITAQATPAPLTDRAVYLRAEPTLELDDPELRAWVKEITDQHQADQTELAEQLRLAVRSYIIHKDLSMGDTTALEAFRAKRGDCKQHAILLCAALRIAGIPARVDTGMVYAEDFGGWVGHAWNSAYVGDRWIHLDSAYPGVTRSRYIRLGSLQGGDTSKLSDALTINLANIMGKNVETLKPE